VQTERQQEAAEKALRERDRLYRHYRAARRSQRQTLYVEHPQGWRLKQFAQQLARFKLPDAAAFLTYVREENRAWLCTAPPDIRHEALSLIDERIMRIRQAHGLLPLDDPLPEEEDSIWQLCKQELTP
jgi:FMN phosphatase YigB (HAD superfamily)